MGEDTTVEDMDTVIGIHITVAGTMVADTTIRIVTVESGNA